MIPLDAEYRNRAAPPGSMRYFALLYASPEQRDALTALMVIDSEIRASTNAAHEVAHTRMQWWRAELDRLINRNPQHPATKLLQSALPNADYSRLHELLVAADMELARMTFNTVSELNAYLERSSIAIQFIAANQDSARALGTWIRRVETIRDLAMDVRAGCIFWPLDEIDAGGVTLAALRANRMTDAISQLLAAEIGRLEGEFNLLQASATEPSLRPLVVLAELHRKLLRQIAAADYDVLTQRHELSPFKKAWTAWRAARRVR
jgi:phytoene synthase